MHGCSPFCSLVSDDEQDFDHCCGYFMWLSCVFCLSDCPYEDENSWCTWLKCIIGIVFHTYSQAIVSLLIDVRPMTCDPWPMTRVWLWAQGRVGKRIVYHLSGLCILYSSKELQYIISVYWLLARLIMNFFIYWKCTTQDTKKQSHAYCLFRKLTLLSILLRQASKQASNNPVAMWCHTLWLNKMWQETFDVPVALQEPPYSYSYSLVISLFGAQLCTIEQSLHKIPSMVAQQFDIQMQPEAESWVHPELILGPRLSC
jgi:hypothetical protein